MLAAQTHFLADIFLRLIRMIVAPLIFGGIMTGIAGHDELRSVGRVAIKALIFFEVVTTLGSDIGAVAINLSQAGVGVTLPETARAVRNAAHTPVAGRGAEYFSGKHCAGGGAEPDFAGGGVCAAVWSGLAMLPDAAGSAGDVAAVADGDHVPGDADRDVPRSAGGGSCARVHRRQHGPGDAASAGEAGGHLLRGAGSICGACAAADLLCRGSRRGGFLGRCRAGGDGICDDHLGSRAAAGDGAHGGVWRAALDCFVCDSDRLQLQHDRVEPVPFDGRDLCRAGCGHASDVWASSFSCWARWC